MTNIQKSSQNITAFGGIYLVNDAFTSCGYDKLIDNELGMSSKFIGYQYSEIFRSIFNLFYCGGNCMEDIQVNFKEYRVASIPFTSFMQESNLRLVVRGERRSDRQADLFTGDDLSIVVS